MGGMISSFCCKFSPQPLINNFINFEEIPGDEFICPKCGNVPEILNIADNGQIKVKCKIDGINIFSLKKYFESAKNSTKSYFNFSCVNCHRIQKEQRDRIFRYCYECQKYFCEDCFIPNVHQFHHYDKVNKMKNKCTKHLGEILIGFCVDCQENVCRNDLETNHKEHNIINIGSLNSKYLNSRRIIHEQNKILSNIIKFNNLIVAASENSLENYFYLKNVINLGDLIEKRNNRDLDNVECALYELDQSIKNSVSSIADLKQSEIFVKHKETFLHLDKNLNFENFKLISKIKFNQLKEINFSGNNIRDIKPFYKMNLPFLEHLNMSHNAIEEIEPIAELNSKNLKEIFLHYNNISNLAAFSNSNFPSLEILRVEENINIESSNGFEIIKEKYKNTIIYKLISFDDIKEKYKIKDNSNQNNIIDLSDQNGGEELLKILYIFLTNDFKNKLHKLKLRNNNLKNPSKLKIIYFKKLQILDLSMNNIKNIDFLPEMRLKHLEQLYLDNNKIYNIFPLTKINCRLYTITLYNNNFKNDDLDILEVINELESKNNGIIIKLIDEEKKERYI